MIGLDTNVLVRYLTRDDRKQSDIAARTIRARCTVEEPGYLNLIVLCELIWVLKGSYGYSGSQIATTIGALCQTKNLRVERLEIVSEALEMFDNSGADLADCLICIANLNDSCSTTLTFDKTAAASSGFELLT